MARSRGTRDVLLILILIFVISFLLNYIWESMHEAFLYKVFKCNAEHYILMIMKAALVDASIIVGMYFFVALLWMNMHWLSDMKKAQLYVIAAVGIIIAVIIEYRSAIVLNEWSYLPAMPTIFGIGLSPLVQLSSTGLLTYQLAARLLYRHEAF